jgi:Bacterial low temperature requirement A protein (LtrA)
VTTAPRASPPAEATARGTPDAASGTVRYLGVGGTFRLEAPRLRTYADPDQERHATWFELFFDLVFIAALTQLTDGLARDPTAGTFAWAGDATAPRMPT